MDGWRRLGTSGGDDELCIVLWSDSGLCDDCAPGCGGSYRGCGSKGRTSVSTVRCTLFWRFFCRSKRIARAPMIMSATPPKTPPTMIPVSELL